MTVALACQELLLAPLAWSRKLSGSPTSRTSMDTASQAWRSSSSLGSRNLGGAGGPPLAGQHFCFWSQLSRCERQTVSFPTRFDQSYKEVGTLASREGPFPERRFARLMRFAQQQAQEGEGRPQATHAPSTNPWPFYFQNLHGLPGAGAWPFRFDILPRPFCESGRQCQLTRSWRAGSGRFVREALAHV